MQGYSPYPEEPKPVRVWILLNWDSLEKILYKNSEETQIPERVCTFNLANHKPTPPIFGIFSDSHKNLTQKKSPIIADRAFRVITW